MHCVSPRCVCFLVCSLSCPCRLPSPPAGPPLLPVRDGWHHRSAKQRWQQRREKTQRGESNSKSSRIEPRRHTAHTNRAHSGRPSTLWQTDPAAPPARPHYTHPPQVSSCNRDEFDRAALCAPLVWLRSDSLRSLPHSLCCLCVPCSSRLSHEQLEVLRHLLPGLQSVRHRFLGQTNRTRGEAAQRRSGATRNGLICSRCAVLFAGRLLAVRRRRVGHQV